MRHIWIRDSIASEQVGSGVFFLIMDDFTYTHKNDFEWKYCSMYDK